MPFFGTVYATEMVASGMRYRGLGRKSRYDDKSKTGIRYSPYHLEMWRRLPAPSL